LINSPGRSLLGKNRKLELLEIPEWGTTVYITKMSGQARDLLEAELRDKKSGLVRATIVAYTVCDEKGNLLFAPEDLESIAKEPYQILDKIAEVAYRLNEISDDAIIALKKT